MKSSKTALLSSVLLIAGQQASALELEAILPYPDKHYLNARDDTSTSCTPIHIIVARASGEAAGQGILSSLSTRIIDANPSGDTTVEAVDYPATLLNYVSSSSNGTEATKKQLEAYVDACPDAKIVLLGYSQGAHVVGDAICGGGGGALGNYTAAVASSYSDKVVAMIQMGDPRHLANKTYDVGTSIKDGLFPRESQISCDPFGDKIQSYCDTGDTYCDLGTISGVHGSYLKRYSDAALDFVQEKLGNPVSNSTSNSTSSASATAATVLPTSSGTTTTTSSNSSATGSSSSSSQTSSLPLAFSSAATPAVIGSVQKSSLMASAMVIGGLLMGFMAL